MKKSTKFMLLIATALFLSLGMANPAAAAPFDWYMSITNTADLVEGEWFSLDLYFHNSDNGDPGVANDGANNLNLYFLDLRYDTSIMDYTEFTQGTGYTEYIDHYGEDPPGPPPATQIWDGGLIPNQPSESTSIHPYDLGHGHIRDIMGTEPLGNNFVFYPDDGMDPTAGEPYNLMARVWFKALVTGHYDDLGVEWFAPDTDSYIKVDWVKYDVEQGHQFITWEEDGLVKCTYDPVPVPAAVWLLGSGLVGLIGIRRRKQ
jgi:hypothetical protein